MARLTPALMRALDILELFVDEDARLNAAEVAAATTLPRSTVHELTTTLVARGYLEREADGSFGLGRAALHLGNAYTRQFDLLGVATDVARLTATRTGETCSVGVLQGADVFYLAKVEGEEAMVLASHVGRRVPAHCAGLGKAMLAFLRQDELRARLPERLVAFTDHTITTRDELETVLAKTRERGWAIEREESGYNVACAAAPVRDVRGEVVAALSISVPLRRWDQYGEQHWGDLALEAAATLSTRIGHRHDDSDARSTPTRLSAGDSQPS